MKIAIYSRGKETVDVKDLQILLDALKQRNCVASLYQGYFDQIKNELPHQDNFSTFSKSEDLDETFDCLISLGEMERCWIP